MKALQQTLVAAAIGAIEQGKEAVSIKHAGDWVRYIKSIEVTGLCVVVKSTESNISGAKWVRTHVLDPAQIQSVAFN